MQIGESAKLKIDRITPVGAFLTDPSGKEGDKAVLLPKKELPDGAACGDLLSVFLYLDSEDRPVATRMSPKLFPGRTGRLRVKALTRIGAFLDWGLPKDVLLPYAEQTRRVAEGEEVLCAVYSDKSGRLAATMNVYPYLRTDSPYLPDMQAEGTVYETSRNFGAFVAVDDLYSGLIPLRELYGEIRIGDTVQVRVAKVQPDGKLTLSLRKKAYLQAKDDAALLLERLERDGGTLLAKSGEPLTEKADPELIRQTLQMSKSAFKRALGKLYKEEKILFAEDGSIKKTP